MREHPRYLRRDCGRVALLLASSALALPVAAQAQTAAGAPPPAASATPSSPSTDEIIVTGQVPPDAVIGDIPAENKMSQAEISSLGVDSISDLLDAIADQTTSIAGRDSSSGPVVLVNGKRISGINEVGDLPAESVLRVDILPEEVAIKYGYDAQSKVVNIILKRRFKSQVASLSGGATTHGDGEQGTGALVVTRIHENDRLNLVGRVNAQSSILESERDIVADPNSKVSDVNGIADDRKYRTLQPSTRNYTLGASYAHQLSSNANLSLNFKGTYKTSDALNGLASGELSVPASNPFSGGSGQTVTRYLNDQALKNSTDSGSASAGATVNVDLSNKWKLSVIGSYTHSQSDTWSENGYDLADLQAAIDAGDPTVDPYGTLPSSLLGNVRGNRAKSNTDTGSASALISGKVLPLPAGDLGVSLTVGGDFTSQTSETTRDSVTNSSKASRTNATTRLSVDVPLTSKSKGFLGAIGTLSLNFNGGLTNVSDYGTLGTFGYGLNWTPVKGVTIIAAMNEDRSAPTVSQLSDPTTIASNQRVYDYVSGQSVLVSSITGGNPNLKADDRHSFKLGLNAQLLSTPKLNFSANYVDARNRNAIMSLGAVTQDVEDAFPDRFSRDADGTLTSVDSRPVNVYRQRTQQVRWGFNISAELRKAKRPAFPRWRPGDGGPPPGWARPGARGRPDDVTTPPGVPVDNATSSGLASPPPADSGDHITVTGERPQDAAPNGFPPPPPGGFPPPPEGMDGPPPEGMPPPPDGFGPPPGGPDGPGGGPGGGFGPGGPGGGFGGRGGRGFSGGSDNGVRLMASIYHTWVLRQDVQLTQGGDTIDLLHGGTLNGNATPQHKVTATLGLTDNGLGMRLEGNWQSAASVSGESSGSGSGDLHFGSLATLDLRIFANLQNRLRGKTWARGMRVSLSVDNLFNTRQRVTDATGQTPYAYQKDYLDPNGRNLLISLRRIF